MIGVTIDHKLKFDIHTKAICNKIKSKVFLLARNKYLFTPSFLILLFKIFIVIRLTYCSTLFTHLSNSTLSDRLISCFNSSLNKLTNLSIHKLDLFSQYHFLKQYNILPFQFLTYFRFITFTHSLFTFNHTSTLFKSFTIFSSDTRTLRNKLLQPSFKKPVFQYSYVTTATKILNLFLSPLLHLSLDSLKMHLLRNDLIKTLYTRIQTAQIFGT